MADAQNKDEGSAIKEVGKDSAPSSVIITEPTKSVIAVPPVEAPKTVSETTSNESESKQDSESKKEPESKQTEQSRGKTPFPKSPTKAAAAADVAEPPTSKYSFISNPERKINLKQMIKSHLAAGACQMKYEPWELHQLLDLAKASLHKQSTLVELNAPVNICGDIHGQYSDLMRIFIACGLPFKWDYVDRGKHSLEVIVLLLACKIKYPQNVFLLRGNHELAHINKEYGFLGEVKTRFTPGDVKFLYEHFNEVFAEMPLAALVSGKILCMHGGLSPYLNKLDDIRDIKRPLTLVRGLAQDLLWADPETGVRGFQPNKVRRVSHIFGEDAVRQKIEQLKIDMVIRAHQVAEYGYAFFASRRLITVFSAARYHDELCNFAAVVQVDEMLEITFLQLKPAEFDKHKKASQEITADEGTERDNNK